jgi:predicted Zn-dependent protease
MPRAGYDPQGLVTFLSVVLDEEKRGRPPSFLSSHPATKERIEEVSALVAAAPPQRGLHDADGRRLQIIRRRIELLTRKSRPNPGGRAPL